MVTLYNIIIENDKISCNYIPEDSNRPGKVVVNISTKEIDKVEYSDYEYGKKMYVAHVRSKLIELLESGKSFPEKVTVTWF